MDIFRVQDLYAGIPEFVGEEEGDEKTPQDPIFVWAKTIEAKLQNGKLHGGTLLIACHGAASVAADTQFNNLRQHIATLVLPETPLRLTVLPSAMDNDIGLYQITPTVNLLICRAAVPAERANDMRRVLFNHLQPARVVVFGHMSGDSYRPLTDKPPCAPFLRHLRTSHYTDKVEVPVLEAPNMANGLAASTLSHCELHGVPAAAYLSYVDNQGASIATVDALAPVLAAEGGAVHTAALRKEITHRLALLAPSLSPVYM